jgi:hypothetical protein
MNNTNNAPSAILTYEFTNIEKPGAAGNTNHGTGSAVFFGDAQLAHNAAYDYIKMMKSKFPNMDFENVIIASELNADMIDAIDV